MGFFFCTLSILNLIFLRTSGLGNGLSVYWTAGCECVSVYVWAYMCVTSVMCFRQLQLMLIVWPGPNKAHNRPFLQQPGGVQITPLSPHHLQALRQDSWPPLIHPSPSHPPLISVRQLYMLGLTISPETRVWVVSPPPPPPEPNKHPLTATDIKIHQSQNDWKRGISA